MNSTLSDDLLTAAGNQSTPITKYVTTTIILPVVFSLVCTVGLIGNGLVLFAMWKVSRHSITDIFVTNLAMADFLFLSMLPFWTTELALNNRWVFGYGLCTVTSASTLVHMYASIFFLAAMAADRVLAVVFYAVSGRVRTRLNALVGSVVIWSFSMCLSIVPGVFRGLVTSNITGYTRCTWTFDESLPSHKGWFIFHAISRSMIGFALPLLVIAVCYGWIALYLNTRKTRGKLTGKLQDRATVLVLVVIAVFVFCWTPNQISNFVYVAQALELMETPTTPSEVHYNIHMFSTCLAWGHSCMNPILYGLMRKDLKARMTSIVCSATGKCVTMSCGRYFSTKTAFTIRGSNSSRKQNNILVDGSPAYHLTSKEESAMVEEPVTGITRFATTNLYKSKRLQIKNKDCRLFIPELDGQTRSSRIGSQ